MSHNTSALAPYITEHTKGMGTAGAGQSLVIKGFGLGLSTVVDIPAALGVETARTFTKTGATAGVLTITLTVESFTEGTSTSRVIPISMGGVPCQGVGVTGGAITVSHGFQPTDVASLQCWYDASDEQTITYDADDNNKVSLWNDKSGNGFHAIQNSGSEQPKYMPSGGAINQAHIRFGWDGVDNYLQPATDTAWSTLSGGGKRSASCFAVFHSPGDGGAAIHGIVAAGAQNSPDITYSVQTTGTRGVYVYSGGNRATGGTVYSSLPTKILAGWLLTDSGFVVRVNGSVDDTDSSSTGTSAITSRLWVGHQWVPSQWANIEVSEILVFNTELTGTDLSYVEEYLRAKWSIWT